MLWSGALRAGCPDPDRPIHEVTDMVESLNYYAEGATLCIVSVRPDWCGSSCRSGYRHVCGQDGHWNPVGKCSSLEKKDAKLRSADSSSSQFGPDSTASMMREQMEKLEFDEETKKQPSAHETGVDSYNAGTNEFRAWATAQTARLREESEYNRGQGWIDLANSQAQIDQSIPQIQATPSRLSSSLPAYPSTAPVVSQSALPERRPVPLKQPNSGASPSGSQQTHCLKLSDTSDQGAISTETASFINTCSYRVGYTYCVDDAKGGGTLGCRSNLWGSGHAPANESDLFSIMGATGRFTVYWVECGDPDAPNSFPIATATRFDSSGLHGKCQ